MTSWVERAAEVLSGGRHDRCEAGHARHDRRVVDSALGPMAVFAWEAYADHAGLYCTGQDEVSKSIEVNGIWEKPETEAVSWLLNVAAPGIVVDLGCHIGWYTVLAAQAGHEVLAVDADLEHLELLHTNVRRLAPDRVTTARGWVGPDTPVLDDDGEILLVKSDLEGLEHEVVRILRPLLAARRVRYALVEVSPVFAAHYPDTICEWADYGYDAYVVTPGVLPGEQIERADLRPAIEAMTQENFVMVRR